MSAADSLAQVRAALADRYPIERELGRGANAIVYLARDVKHDRPVALKFLKPDLAQTIRAERFLREIRVAAKFTHPHVLALYDSGQVDGFLYYVMPYIAGESLRDRMTREGQLGLDDALQIAREVLDALSYAHTEGVVHRDIKPDNILLQAGHAVVADFGIAGALAAAGGEIAEQTGHAVGTPLYMSPEQTAATHAVDARSDIYSLGCVLYEMLAGHPPFAGATLQELLARHALDPVPNLRAARTAVPANVERALTKALAKQPADRFASAGDFARALTVPAVDSRRRKLVVAIVAVALIGGAGFAVASLLQRPPDQSVAVLPFVNIGGDTDNEYFSDGITEDVINALTQIPGLRVPARTSSFAFKGKDADIREIGRQLGVAHVVEGSARRLGSQLRVTAQLIKVADGYHLWSEQFEREIRDARDVFAVQDEITRAIVTRLQVKFAGDTGARLVRTQTEDYEAYQFYLRGRYLWNQRTIASIQGAIQQFQAAIASDSGYALAYAGLADAYYVVRSAGYWSLASRDTALARQRSYALRALALDETLPEGHVALAPVLSTAWDWDGAEREYRRAIELNPGYAWAHSQYSQFLSTRGRDDEAVSVAQHALQLDPLSTTVNPALALINGRRYDEAIAALRRAAQLEPNYPTPHQALGRAYLAKGLIGEAITELERALALPGERPYARGLLGNAYARAGRWDDARKVIAELQRRRATDESNQNFPMQLALVHIGLGEFPRALELLSGATPTPATFLSAQLLGDPAFDPVRADPRFQNLLRAVRR